MSKIHKKTPKIHSKSNQKQDAILDASWMALGAILAGFWLQVGRQNGAKIQQNWLKKVVEKRVKKSRHRELIKVCTRGASDHRHHRSRSRGRGKGGGKRLPGFEGM